MPKAGQLIKTVGRFAGPAAIVATVVAEGANSTAAVYNAAADGKSNPEAEIPKVLVKDTVGMVTTPVSWVLQANQLEKIPFTNIPIPPAVQSTLATMNGPLGMAANLDRQTGGHVLKGLESAQDSIPRD